MIGTDKAIPSRNAIIEMARTEHLYAAKRLSDKYKQELGFINQAILRNAIESSSLIVASQLPDVSQLEAEIELVGFVHFYVRRDSRVSLYSIVVAQAYRGKGVGRQLFEELVKKTCSLGKTEIRLKCPIELPANAFYEHLSLKLIGVEAGKHRPLNVWAYIANPQ